MVKEINILNDFFPSMRTHVHINEQVVALARAIVHTPHIDTYHSTQIHLVVKSIKMFFV